MKKDSKKLCITCTARRPDLMLEEQDEQKILIVNIVCKNEMNKTEKRTEKIQRY